MTAQKTLAPFMLNAISITQLHKNVFITLIADGVDRIIVVSLVHHLDRSLHA
jgi:hypothetical protein